MPLVLTTDVNGFLGGLVVDDSRVYWIEKPGAQGGTNGAIRSVAKTGGPENAVTDLLTIAAGRDPRDLVLDNLDIYFLTGSDGLSKVSKLGGTETNITNQFGIVSGTGTRRGNNPLDLAIDAAHSRLFVSNLDTQGFGSIQSVSKFGGAITTVRRADGLGDIAAGHRSVYWFESETGQIVSAPLTGTSTFVEVSGLGTGYNGGRVLRTDVDEGLYWGNGDGTIRRYVGGTESILATDYRPINYNGYAGPVVIDEYLGNIYYLGNNNDIRYVPKTGGPSQTLVTNTIVAAMGIDQGHIYWGTDFGRIRLVDKPAGVPAVPNRTPVINLPTGGTLNFAQNGPAIVIAPGATVTPSTQSFAGGNLTISIPVNGSSNDVLEIAPDGTGPGQIGLSGSTVSYGGTGIGTFSGGSGNSSFVIILNASATAAAIQALIRRVTFRTSGSPPSTAARTVQFQVTNSDAWTGSASQSVGVISQKSSAGQARMFRAYNPNADYHFFTIAFAEFANAVTAGYRDESSGQAGFAVLDDLVAGATPIHRMYNPNTGRHYYTLSDGERNVLVSVGWRYEKDEGFMYTAAGNGATEIFRLYNKNSGVHLYTENAGVKDAVLQQFAGTWVKHDSLGFAFVLSAGATAQATAPAVQSATALPPPLAAQSTFTTDPFAEPVAMSIDGGLIDQFWEASGRDLKKRGSEPFDWNGI